MSGAYNKVCPDLLAIDRHHANCIIPIVEKRDIVLVGYFCNRSNIVLICKLVIVVVDHHEHRKFSGLCFDLFDLLCRGFCGNEVLFVQRYFPGNPAKTPGIFSHRNRRHLQNKTVRNDPVTIANSTDEQPTLGFSRPLCHPACNIDANGNSRIWRKIHENQ